jgi:hypothetical protein
MKQIILQSRTGEPFPTGCPTRTLVTWALYGVAVYMLWCLVGTNPWAQASVWGLALLAGLALAVGTAEV